MEKPFFSGRLIRVAGTGLFLLLASGRLSFAEDAVPADPFSGPRDLVLHGYRGPVFSVETGIQDDYVEHFGEWRVSPPRLLTFRIFDREGRLRLVSTNLPARPGRGIRLGTVERILDSAGKMTREIRRLPDGRLLTVTHHTDGGSIQTNWIYGPEADPERQLVVWYAGRERVKRRLESDGAGRRLVEAHYDALGRLQELVGSGETLQRSVWGPAGEPRAVSTWQGSGEAGRVVFSYDGDGRMLAADRFDGAGARLGKIVYRYAGPDLLAQRAVFDGMGRLIQEELRERDGAGRLLALRLMDGEGSLLSRRTCRYGGAGELVERLDATGDLMERRSWDRDGLVLERASLTELATVWKTAYGYDRYGRLIRLEAWNGRDERTRLMTVRYDRHGNPVELVDQRAVFEPGYSFRELRNSVYEYEYDTRGNWTVCRVFRRVRGFGGVRLEPERTLSRRFVYYGSEE